MKVRLTWNLKIAMLVSMMTWCVLITLPYTWAVVLPCLAALLWMLYAIFRDPFEIVDP